MQTILGDAQNILNPFQCHFEEFRPVTIAPRIPGQPLELPVEIWFDIMQLATYYHHPTSLHPADPFMSKRATAHPLRVNTPAAALRTKLALVRVSKSWRALALPMLYEHLVIRSPMRAELILKALQESLTTQNDDSSNVVSSRSRGYGDWTRTIEVFTHSRGCGDIQYLQTIFSILRCCTNVRVLSGNWTHRLPSEFLNGVSMMLGPELEGLHWNETHGGIDDFGHEHVTSATLGFLGSFKALRILDLRHFKPRDLSTSSAEKFVLPAVEDLMVSAYSWSLTTATQLSLPRLRSLTIAADGRFIIDNGKLELLVKVHGDKLENVDLPILAPDDSPASETASMSHPTVQHNVNLDVFLAPGACPNLTSIVFPVTAAPPVTHFHPTLRRIGLRGVRSDSIYPHRQGKGKEHLQAINSDLYPALELVQTIGFLVEAETDHLIKDVFIWWVEKLEKDGINLLDGEGVLWAYTEPEESAESGQNKKVELDAPKERLASTCVRD